MTKKEVALAYSSPITTFTSSIDTLWEFDKNNRLISFKDDATNESTWAYDAKDRTTSLTYPNATSIAYVYDANDNVTQVTDAAGNVISDTFDALNRNTARSISLVSGFIDTTSESRTFDALNRILTNDDNDYKLTYTYGVRGLASTVYEEKQEYATGTAYQKVVTTKYDAVGNRTYEQYPSSLTLTYAYTDINALSSVTDGTNSIASMTYVGFRPKVTTFGNSTTATYSYGGFRDDVTTIHHETSTPTTLVRLDYGYNKLHDRTYERYGTSGSAGDAFEYDKARRLTKAWMGSSTPSSPSGNTYVKTIVYNMDDDGNRTSVVTTPYGVSPTTQSYTTNTLNQYTAVGGASPTYDGNGNLANDGTYKFKYNYKNLICEARLSSNNNLVATYSWDAAGRRSGKAVSGGVTERFVCSGIETVAVYDGSSGWKQNLVFDVTGIDRILMLEQADVLDQDSDSNTAEVTRSFYHRSALGSVLAVTAAGQTEVESYRYAPYGEVTISRGGASQSSDPLGQHSTYSGRIFDEEISRYQYRFRDLDSRAGRFAQRDPVGYRSAAGLFEYARSGPTSHTDPLGLWPPDGYDVWDALLDLLEDLLPPQYSRPLHWGRAAYRWGSRLVTVGKISKFLCDPDDEDPVSPTTAGATPLPYWSGAGACVCTFTAKCSDSANPGDPGVTHTNGFFFDGSETETTRKRCDSSTNCDQWCKAALAVRMVVDAAGTAHAIDIAIARQSPRNVRLAGSRVRPGDGTVDCEYSAVGKCSPSLGDFKQADGANCHGGYGR